MEKIYVCGHRHPDTDSIVSSIAYSYLKQQTDEYAIACRLGPCNEETKYLLNRFDFDEPLLLEDARVRLSEISLEPAISVHEDETIFETLAKMKQHNQPFVSVVNHQNKVTGMITRNDLADIGLGDTAFGIDLLKNVSLDNICKTLQGKIIVRDDQMKLNGKVSIVALSKRLSADYEVKNRIVIIGDDPISQKHLIQKGAGLLIIVWANSVEEDVIELAKEYHCPILISGYGSMNTSRYLFFSPEIQTVMKENVMCFYEDEFLEDVAKKMSKKRYRAYPVIDSENYLTGYILKDHAMSYKNKSIILVDHNEFSQSVRAIEKAQLLEVVDHHRINDFMTRQPVAFRSEIVGSTSTIIASMFRENQIPMPSSLAGLLLGAVLSDTLMLMSPTTTDKDIAEANILAALADLDIDTFGKEMFEVSARHGDEPYSALYGSDLKYFEIRMKRVGITQIMVSDLQAIRKESYEIENSLMEYTANRDTDLFLCVFTSIGEKGSVFYACGNLAGMIKELYPDKEGETHSIQYGILSRKAQILPDVSNLISEYY